MSEELKWYVIHTYSGYENKVKANLERVVENRELQEIIKEIVVPTQDVVEIKNGKKKTVQRKIFPGYVIVKMLMNDDTWSIVRSIRGVTSFVGPGSKPSPLSDSEILSMGIAPVEEFTIDINEGDTIKVISGPFENSIATIQEINISKRTVIVKISVFGRETPVELNFAQIQRI